MNVFDATSNQDLKMMRLNRKQAMTFGDGKYFRGKHIDSPSTKSNASSISERIILKINSFNKLKFGSTK